MQQAEHQESHSAGERLQALSPVFVGLVAFIAYWLTLQPGLSGGDSAEAQFVPYTLSIMHYTGYPLYTLLGFVWSHMVVIGDVAYRMNLLSAVAGAVAVGLLVWSAYLVSGSWPAGIVAGVMLGCSTLFWDWSAKAGVRSMNVAFLVAVIGLTIAWGQANKKRTASRWWFILWLVVGLSLAHHRTTILLLPGVGLYILLVRIRVLRDWKAIVVAILALLPGILTYIYPLWRGADYPAYQPLAVDNFDHFLDLVLARNLSDMVTAITWQQVPQRIGWFIDYLVTQFGAGGLLMAAGGLLMLAVRRPREGLLLWLSLFLLTAFTIDYRIEGMSRLNVVFLLPVHAIVALGLGYLMACGYDGFTVLVKRRKWLPSSRPLIAACLTVFCLAVPGVPMVSNSLRWVYHGTEQPMHAYREELRGLQAVRLTTYPEVFAAPGAVIVGEWEHAAAFWYEQLINHRWKGATFRYPVDSSLGTYIDQAWSAGREIYVTRAVPGLGDGRYLSMSGPLIHILHQPETQIPSQTLPLNVEFDDGLGLAGYEVYLDSFKPGGVLPVSLYWQTDRQLSNDDSISIRLRDADGNQVAQEDAVAPVLGSYPTTKWPVRSVVGDYYELGLPSGLQPGAYQLAVVIYQRQPDGTSRNVLNASDGQIVTVFAAVTMVATR